VFVQVFIAGIFMTLVNDSINQVNADTAQQSNEYEIVAFMQEKFAKYLQSVKYGLKDLNFLLHVPDNKPKAQP